MTEDVVSTRFSDAGLAEDRFVSVRDGTKMCVDHDTRYNDPGDVPGESYGIYCDEEDQLLILDVDVHRGGGKEHNQRALVALANLGFTLRVRSPHADPDVGGHRILELSGDETPAELFDRVFGRKNPMPSWGEVVSKNKYVVGPGSHLDDCDKEWCQRCAEPDGGRYDVEEDREIATVGPEELVEALGADPDLKRKDQPDHSDVTEHDDVRRNSTEYGGDDLSREQVEELLDAIPGDQHFDDWIRTGYAVYSWDSEETGKEVFTEWSKENKKWERDESQRQIDYIWQNGDDTDRDGNAGVGTLVHTAREHDYDGALGAEPTDGPGDPPEQPDEKASPDWSHVRSVYAYAEQEQSYPKGNGRQAAADMLEKETAWMYVLESERLWVYEEESGRYDRYGRSYAAKRLESELGEHYTQTERREVIGRLEARNQVHRDVINARQRDDPLLCASNGVVNLRTGELLEHGPEYRFVRGLDVAYDPAAAEPERILDFLDDITQRVADRDTLLDHLAHGLMPGHPYRAFVVCYGPGGNGKTQASELFRGFVGRHNAAAVEIDELAAGDFATGDLPGKYLNWGDDMAGDGGGKLSDLSILKKATGGSEIRANEKYEKTFNFKNEAAMFFSANEPPRIGEQKMSIQDRIYPIEMPYRFTSDPDPADSLEKEKTPNIAKTLLDDEGAMKGLLVLAVQHAQELIENRGEYSQPESPEERLEKYNRSADPIVKFGGKLVEEASADARIRKDDAYRVYRAFTESIEERSASERGFKRQLPGAVPMEIEDGQSRALATPGDESDRVRCWKRMRWTDTAKQHMPGWMVERYTNHFSAEDSGEKTDEQSDGEDKNPSINELEPGRHDLTVTVAETMEPKPWQQARGHIVDGEGNIMQYVAEGTDNPMAHVEQGDRIEIRDAKLESDRDGVLQVAISGVCEVTVANRAEGQSGLEDAGGGEESTQTAVDGGRTEDRPDPGTDQRADAQYLAELLEGRGSLTKTQIRNEAKSEYDMNIGRAGEVLEWAVENTRLIESVGQDEYRAM